MRKFWNLLTVGVLATLLPAQTAIDLATQSKQGGGGPGGGGVTDPGSNGIMVRTALNTAIARTLAVGSGRLSLTNPSGVSGNPTLDIIEANLLLPNLGGLLNTSQLASVRGNSTRVQIAGPGTPTANDCAKFDA